MLGYANLLFCNKSSKIRYIIIKYYEIYFYIINVKELFEVEVSFVVREFQPVETP
jgi:hypothetical protein